MEGDTAKILVTVTDTGIGMTSEQKERIFESFQQAETGTTRKFGGTGLGLSISKGIVEMMGGEIWVDSVPGEGASFHFTVMMQKSDKTCRPLHLGDDVLKNLRILVADNDKIVLEYFTEIIQNFGICVDTALSGKDALNLVHNNGDYDLYILDWKMPGMNGIELANTLRKNDEKASIIIITAAEMHSLGEDVKEAGIKKFLTKPIFPTDIADIINDHLGADTLHGETAQPDAKGLFKNHKILIAEDVDVNREIIQSLLEPTLLEIDFAENGKEAVRIFSEKPNKHTMIFMDLQMPEMDGYEATRCIRAIDSQFAKDIPIIAMTANVFKDDVENAIQQG